MDERAKYYVLLAASLIVFVLGIVFIFDLLKTDDKDVSAFEKQDISPRMNLGYGGEQFYTPELKIKPDLAFLYKTTDKLKLNQIGLDGVWFVERDRIVSLSNNSILTVEFRASTVTVSLSGDNSLPIRVEIDSVPVGKIQLKGPGEYEISTGISVYDVRELTLYVPRGISVYNLKFH